MNNNDPRVKTLNPKIGGPIALILVLGVTALFIYGYIKDSQNNKEYLATPKAGDIYYTRDDLRRYSVMRAIEILGDEMKVEKGNFTVKDKKQLHDKEWTFSPPVWIKMSELRRMYDVDEIMKIIRPQTNE
jgi:hypothetical protein